MANAKSKTGKELVYPENVRYHKEHTWARREGDLIRVGISDFAQDQLGDIIYFELPAEGDCFAQGDEFGSVESAKVVSTLYMPVSGEVVEVNDDLNNNPEATNSDPYDSGWIITVKAGGADDYDNLLTGREYQDFLAGK